MAKARIEHLIPDYDSNTIEVVGGAKGLNDEERAQLDIFIKAGFKPIFTTRPQSEKQILRAEKAKGKGKDYYLETIKDEDEKATFTRLLKKPYNFMFAKKWYEHKDDAAKTVGAKSWADADESKRAEAIEWLKTVKFVKGEPKSIDS